MECNLFSFSTIWVDNSMVFPYRPDTHTVSDSVGNSWNGIVGKIELIPVSLLWLDDISVYPDYRIRSSVIQINVKNISFRGIFPLASGEVPSPLAGYMFSIIDEQ